MDPSALAQSYNTDQGMFRPAPQPPRKGPTAPSDRKLPVLTQSSSSEEDEQLLHSLHDSQWVDAADGQESGHAACLQQPGDADIALLLKHWFLEQRSFQRNVTLQQQYSRLVQKLKRLKELFQKQHHKVRIQHKEVRAPGKREGDGKVAGIRSS